MRSGDQTKIGAAVETFGNTAVGFFMAYATYMWIVTPMFDLDVTWADNFWISVIMTTMSLIRQYTIRRIMTRKK